MPRYWTKEHDGDLVHQHASAAHLHHDAPHCHCLDNYLQVMLEEDGIMINDSDVCRTTNRARTTGARGCYFQTSV